MKMYIDTCNTDELFCLEMTKEEENSISNSMLELVSGFSALSIDYIMKMRYMLNIADRNQIKEQIVSLFSAVFAMELNTGVLEKTISGNNQIEKEIDKLRTDMENTGSFSKEEIDAVVRVVIETGSVDEALVFYKDVAKEHDIDLDK